MNPQLLEAIQDIARSLHSHFWPGSFADVVQALLVIITGITAWYLKKYTDETVRLRIATTQVLKEAERQNEYSMMPIILMKTLSDAANGSALYVQNTGRGPAFNVRTSCVDVTSLWSFNHRAALSSDAVEKVVAHTAKTEPKNIGEIMLWLKQHGRQLQIETSYDSALGQRYRSLHTFILDPNDDDLTIHFNKFEEVP